MSQVELSCLNKENLCLYRKWRNDPQVYTWCRQYEPITRDHHIEWFNSLQNNPKIKMYQINDINQAVGVCGLTDIDYINSRAEFSLYIDPEKQGGGLGQTALCALLGHAFNVLNLNLVWGESFEGNPAIKMFEKIGFKKEGTRRQYYFRNGVYIDAILFSITREEFKQKKFND